MKKTLSLLLALLLLIALFSGCRRLFGGPSATPSNLTPVENAASGEDAAAAPEKPQYALTSNSDLTRLDGEVYVLLAPDPAGNAAGAAALANWILSFRAEDLLERYASRQPGLGMGLCAEAHLSDAPIPRAKEETKSIRVAADPAVTDTELLDYMLPVFEGDYGYEVAVTPATTEEAAELLRQGQADLLVLPIADAAELLQTGVTAAALPWLSLGN